MNPTEEHIATDYLVIGGGVAGLRAAIELARSGEVMVVTKAAPSESSSEYAQGGVAVVLSDEDEISIHYEDTLKAGAGLCNRKAVRTLVEEGPMRIRELIVGGAEFDREGSKLAFTQEAAHSKRRILHAHGDSTGREIMRVLVDKVRAAGSGSVQKIDFAFTADLLMHGGRCVGAVALREPGNKTLSISAKAVVLATGGAGQLYQRTTNPLVATGDGMAMAFRAGAALVDMEFIQFHPTALYLPGTPQFLLSEAMRGEGGKLLNVQGLRFMGDYHPSLELAPRDVVTRAIHSEMARTGSDHVSLDMTHLNPQYVMQRFPRIHATCKEYGIDITAEPIPVSPAAHYIMGGVKTDVWGRTSVPGLFAAGETACTGVHGANRLASNSLLEGLVYGERAGLAAARYGARRKRIEGTPPSTVFRNGRTPASSKPETKADAIRQELKALLWQKVGIVRNGKDLQAALKRLNEWDRLLRSAVPDRQTLELRNMLTTGRLIALSALMRENSVGAHYRSDFPGKGKNWRKRMVLEKGS